MVMNNEVNPKYLAERLRECAREMDHPRRRTFQSAADLIENQQTCIEALQKRLEMAQGERDVVTKRMIELEQQNAALEADIRKMLDCCDICIHQNDMPACDGECSECTGCTCRECTDGDKFQYRGVGE